MFAFVMFLTVFLEGFVEYFVSKEDKAQPYLKYIALVLGIFLAVVFQVNLLELIPLQGVPEFDGIAVYVLYVMSGVVISRGSNYLNDFFGRQYVEKKAYQAELNSLE